MTKEFPNAKSATPRTRTAVEVIPDRLKAELHTLDFKEQSDGRGACTHDDCRLTSAGRSMFAFGREPVFAQSGNRLGSLVVKSSLMEPWFRICYVPPGSAFR